MAFYCVYAPPKPESLPDSMSKGRDESSPLFEAESEGDVAAALADNLADNDDRAPGPVGLSAAEAQWGQKITAIRDGFSFFAFSLPMVWLIYHKLWRAFAAFMLLQIMFIWLVAAYGEQGALWLFGGNIIISLYIGLEAHRIRSAPILRQNYQMVARYDSSSAERAVARYLDELR